jgi:hypothetical protein
MLMHPRQTDCTCGQGIRDWTAHADDCAYIVWLRTAGRVEPVRTEPRTYDQRVSRAEDQIIQTARLYDAEGGPEAAVVARAIDVAERAFGLLADEARRAEWTALGEIVLACWTDHALNLTGETP